MPRYQRQAGANALLEKLLAEKAAEEAAEPAPEASDVTKEIDWLEGYARGKPIRNFGGNFYGINRNRCTIIKPVMVKAILASGRATGNEQQFTIPVTKKAR